MTTVRVVQKGSGNLRTLVVLYHLSAQLDDVVRRACDPDAAILNLTGPAFKSAYVRIGAEAVKPLASLHAYVLAKLGAEGITRTILAGFSEGCQGVRAHLSAREFPDIVVCADGTHASLPAAEAQLTPWRAMIERADAGKGMFFASHTEIRTDLVKPPYLPTRRLLERVTGWTLGPVGPDVEGYPYGPSNYVVRESENRRVRIRSYPGGTAPDHVHQAKFALPEQLQEAFETWKELG